MSGPVLLVHDDIATLATVRRLLTREGLEIILATSAADALIAFGHYAPAVIILAPSVEGGRGRVVLDELLLHPDAARAKVVLLGQGIDGSSAPVVPLPLDGAQFLDTVHSVMQGEASVDQWCVREARADDAPAAAADAPPPAEEPGPAPLAESALFADLPPVQQEDWGLAVGGEATQLNVQAPPAPVDAMMREALERAQAEVEAEAIASLSQPAAETADEAASTEDATHLEIRAPLQGAEEIDAEDPGAQTADLDSFEHTQPGTGGAPEKVEETPEAEKRLAFEAARALGAFELGETMRREMVELREELTAARAERDAAKADAAAIRAELEQLRETLRVETDQLRSDRDAAEVEITRAEENGRALETELQSVRAEHESALATSRTAHDETRSELQRTREELESLRRENAVSQGSSESAKGELAAALERIRTLEANAEESRRSAEALASALADANADRAQWIRATEDARAETVRERERSDQLLKSSLDEREAEAGARIAALQEELAQAKAAQRASEHAARKLEAAHAEAKASLGTEQHQRLGLAERISELEAERDSLQQTIAGLRDVEAAAAKAERTAREERVSARERIAELEESLAAAQERTASLDTQHAVAEARVRELDAELERVRQEAMGAASERDTLAAEADHLRESQEVLEGRYELLQREFERARRGEAEAEKRAASVRTQYETVIEGLRAYAEPLAARITELEQQLEATRRNGAEDLARLEATAQEYLHALAEARSQLATTKQTLEQKIEEARANAAELQVRALSHERALASQQDAWRSERASLNEQLAARTSESDGLRNELAALRSESDAVREQVGALTSNSEALREQLRVQQADSERLREELARTGQQAAASAEELSQLRDASATELQAAREEAKRLADEIARTIVPLVGPAGESWSLAQTGSTDLLGLARLTRKLALAEAEVRLELKSEAALRVLWLRKGRLVSATSGHPDEWLGASAQRDGLIDMRQLRELTLLRAGSDHAVLEAMRARGWIRDAELAPFLRRHLQRIALEALSAEETAYRIVSASVPEDAVEATSEHPFAALLTDSLRRALTAFEPGAEPFRAAPRLLGPVAFDAFNFSDAERRWLESLDGKTTVQALLLSTGVRTDAALKALSLADALELVEIGPAIEGVELPAPPEVEVQRLSAKWESVSDADYFSVLGLSKTAGSVEVERAFKLLSDEFHPLRYVGHPDGRWRVRAEALQELLKEAAHALADDRLRAEYARNLAD